MNQTYQPINNPSWTDQDMVGDLLAQEKQIMGNYSIGITEGSSEPYRQVLTSNMEQTARDQFSVFQQMQQRGWYPTPTAQPQDVQTAKQKCGQHKNQMC